jgi:hypothetical protein
MQDQASIESAETEAEDRGFSLMDHYVFELRTLDDALSSALYELDRAMKGPWTEDVLPSVQEFLTVFREYRYWVNRLIPMIEEEE